MSKLFDVNTCLTSTIFWRQNLLTSTMFDVTHFWRHKCLTSNKLWRQNFRTSTFLMLLCFLKSNIFEIKDDVKNVDVKHHLESRTFLTSKNFRCQKKELMSGKNYIFRQKWFLKLCGMICWHNCRRLNHLLEIQIGNKLVVLFWWSCVVSGIWLVSYVSLDRISNVYIPKLPRRQNSKTVKGKYSSTNEQNGQKLENVFIKFVFI